MHLGNIEPCGIASPQDIGLPNGNCKEGHLMNITNFMVYILLHPSLFTRIGTNYDAVI